MEGIFVTTLTERPFHMQILVTGLDGINRCPTIPFGQHIVYVSLVHVPQNGPELPPARLITMGRLQPKFHEARRP